MEEIVGLIVDERRSGGVPEQPPGVLQIFDRLENIAEPNWPLSGSMFVNRLNNR